MRTEKFRMLAAIIAAYPGNKLIGRVRLQKTVKLLQSRGLPTNYLFVVHHYGPYSEGVQADINLLEQVGLIKETEKHSQNDRYYSIYEATPAAMIEEINPFQGMINLLASTDSTVLELAATYEAFLEDGLSEREAMQMLRRKKGAKCGAGREAKAIELLTSLDKIKGGAN